MKNKRKAKVFIAMSGGVDSSVAAALLIEQGFEVVGCHMKCFNVDGCAEADAEDARRVAEQLKIPFYVFDLEDAYKKRVVDYMIRGYKQGITPNPDVMCNKEIKFGLFFEKAMKLGADYVATGHYVRIQAIEVAVDDLLPSFASDGSSGHRRLKSRRAIPTAVGNRSGAPPTNSFSKSSTATTNTFGLYSARDKNKDQSYFLWTLTQKQLRHCLFPVGDYTKPQVRGFAKKFGLMTAEKKDSQGICFLGQVSIRDFLKNYIPAKRGAVLTTDGRIVGKHDGAQFYTIGQRNLGIKNMEMGVRGGHGAIPHYVASKDLKKNTITIAPQDDPSLYRKEIKLTDVNFIRPGQWSMVNGQMSVLARVRYRQPLVKAHLTTLRHSQECRNNGKQDSKKSTTRSGVISGGAEYKLVFDVPQKFVAVGQSAVFYSKSGEMLGGGVIVA